jgi:hypothetical protein
VSGNVGIGVTSPVYTLDVSSASSQPFRVSVGTTNAIVVDSAGSVGIGGTNPSNAGFSVRNSSENYINLGVWAATGKRALILNYSGTGTVEDYGLIYVEHQGNAYRNLALNPYGGNVGIGVTSPVYTLDVSGYIKQNYRLMSYYNNSTQSISNVIDTVVTFNKVDPSLNINPNDLGLSISTDNKTFTNNSGQTRIYLVSACTAFSSNNAGFRAIWINMNNNSSLRLGINSTLGTPGGQPTYLSVNYIVPLASGERFDIRVFQDSGAPLDIGSSSTPTFTTSRISILAL